MDYLVAPSPAGFQGLNCSPSASIAPTILSRRFNAQRKIRPHSTNSMPIPADNPRKLVIDRFSPLPSISASPLCTPTTQLPPPDESFDSPEVFTTAPNSPSSSMSNRPPTWISTPPTPPPKMVKRSVTCSARPTSQVLPQSASFPDPNLSHDVGYPMKRCSSVPAALKRSSSGQYPRSDGRYSPSGTVSSSGDRSTPNMANDATVRPSSMNRLSITRPKPLFQVSMSSDTLSDTEDYSPRVVDSPGRMTEDVSVEGAWSDVDSDDSRQYEKAKNDLRKYHALKELIDTEMGYLLDLRALVTVYLRILPTIQCRPAPPSSFTSFTSSPWINSHMNMTGSSANLSDQTTSSFHATRYLLTNQEIEVLTRNAEEILQLHEQFVRELRCEMAPLGFQMDAYQRMRNSEKTHGLALANTDLAIRAVTTKLASEAQRFTFYQSFCAGHLEALNVVKKISSRYPIEWDVFERRCSSLISELELCSVASEDCSEQAVVDEYENVPANVILNHDRGRATSMSSVEGPTRTLRSRSSNLLQREGTNPHTDYIRKEKHTSRLAFADYLIKPVQRICKYPLILEQLKPQRTVPALFPAHLRSNVDNIVESATQAMRAIASSVDEARHRQDVAMQSALIASRISLSSPIMSQMVSQYPGFQFLTQPFLYSLGTCLLAGSLDVIYYETLKASFSSVTAKYLGAFLYPGGYIILVKVSKGKVYEPRHWFGLSDFDIHDVDEADAMLPCSIRLTSKNHQFELAAACQREKDAWISSLRESLTYQPSWVDEPTPSLIFDGKGELIASTNKDDPIESPNTLPTIQSIPERLNKSPDLSKPTESLQNLSENDTRNKGLLQQDSATRSELELPSRRSSTASGRGIFSPMSSDSETIVIRRHSPSARSRVDQGLQDAISQLCVTARSSASIRDEELFQAPKSAKGGFVRSQSGLSVAGMAKNRLIRHESLRVPRHKSTIDRPGLSPKKTPSLPSRRQSKPHSVANLSKSELQAPIGAPISSLPLSSFFPHATVQPTPPSKNSVRHTIFGGHSPSKQSDPSAFETKQPMKTSRSLVNGVKEFFQSRSSSTTSLSLIQCQQPDTENQEPKEPKRHAPSTIKRWARGTLHRRTRSAPNAQDGLLTLPDIQTFPLNVPLGTEEFGTLTTSGSPVSDYVLQNQDPERSPADCQPSFLTSGRCRDSTMHPTKSSSILQNMKA